MKQVAVIMAGGSGERFWPLSRSHYPKQLLRITSDEESLLQEAVSRAIPLFSKENILIATSEKLRNAIVFGEQRIDEKNVLAEPDKRNTTGCLVWAAAQIAARSNDPNTVMAVLTADHRIGDGDRFRDCLRQAMELATTQGQIVTIGAKPSRPETAYGYIEAGDPVTTGTASGYVVERFREKPNLQTAEEFIKAGNFFWNCGMFFWTIGTFFSELETHNPEVHRCAIDICQDFKDGNMLKAVEDFKKLKSISIDYSLLEKTDKVMCVPASFEWDDVGSWDSLDRYRTHDEQNNISDGNIILEDVEDCIVINECTNTEQIVAAVGVRDLVIVNTDDAVLVVPKDQVQNVKKIVARLKEKKAKQI